MESCNANETLSYLDMPRNLSHFMDIVFSSILLSYIVAGSFLKLKKVPKDVTLEKLDTSPRPFLSNLKVVLSLFLSAIALTRLLLHGMVDVHDGNAILGSSLHVFLWPVSLTIIWLRNRSSIPNTVNRSRNWVLSIFWTFAFINDSLTFYNLMTEEWWRTNLLSTANGLKVTLFNLMQFYSASELQQQQIEQYVQPSLFVKLEILLFMLRYLCTLILFITGLRDCVHPQPESAPDNAQSNEKEDKKGKLFDGCLGKLKMFAPFLWPKTSPLHQFFVIVCLLLLVVGRYLSLMNPLIYKELVDSLSPSDKDQALKYRWDLIVFYAASEFLQDQLSNLRGGLWEQVDEFTGQEVQINLFSHVHRLSLGWHLSKKTGEVLEVLNYGTCQGQSLLQHLLFTVIPSIADICIATMYFTMTFNIWFAVILLTTMFLYSGITYFSTDWLSKFTEDVIEVYPEVESNRVDSFLNFETVKCFNTEDYEISKFKKSLMICWTASVKHTLAYKFVQLIQEAVTTGGLLLCSLLCANMIVTKQGMTLGDYVLLATYSYQFFSPMYAFGGLYSYIQRAVKEMEKLYEILNEEVDVKDLPGAPDLVVTEGRIEFKDVSFWYKPEKTILKNISFVVQPGQTTALVGPTGSGKSTIARLLFRLYNIQEGVITIDGQDIAMVTQNSVRRSIGIVPQDTVLFNEDVRFNIRYGDLNASDEKVEEAAVAAEIHDAILQFPDGYKTKVGERGLKLSGGEKQRIAIARTVLKSAPLTLFDEATSSLDTQTERSIQASIKRLCSCRTTIIIAHRLSTIIHAHQICVIKDGEIVERGTHQELLKLGKAYSGMWQAQMFELFQEEVKENNHSGGIQDDSNSNDAKTDKTSCPVRAKRRNSIT